MLLSEGEIIYTYENELFFLVFLGRTVAEGVVPGWMLSDGSKDVNTGR